MRTALIDGDSIAYILGWNFRDSDDANLLRYSIDNFIKSNLLLLEATHYVGALSTRPTFREQVYKYAPYKGTRKADDPGIAKWKPFINNILLTTWEFYTVDYLEADDIVGYLAYKPEFGECIICSPDKDLRQVPGTLYDYKKGEMMIITPEAAEDHFKMQMLCGDTTDNIKGIPGLGPVKARAKLNEGKSVYELYVDYFGSHYGAIIYAETLATVQVIQPGHSHESFFNRRLDFITPIEITF